MLGGRPRTQNGGVLLTGGCHACLMRASACSAKYAHVGCGIKHRTCSLRQFLHGGPGVIGISNDPMSVKVLAGVQRSARRDKREVTADQAAAAGFGRSLTLTLTLTL
jgi:hypothetical protein